MFLLFGRGVVKDILSRVSVGKRQNGVVVVEARIEMVGPEPSSCYFDTLFPS